MDTLAIWNFDTVRGHNHYCNGLSIPCDYGPEGPAFKLAAAPMADARGWIIDVSLLKEARNIGEAEAIERHLIRGETVTWCDQGYSWVEQDAVHWFYAAAFVFVVLPYLIVRIKARARRTSEAHRAIDGRQRLAS